MSNPNPPVNRNWPDRAVVERIAAEEATAAQVALSLVVGMSREPKAIRARQRAMVRVLKETGCSIDGLASVWGCYPESVRIALGAPVKAARREFDPMTRERLRWVHSEARAAQIIEGRDPNTINDLASWRRVIAHGRSM